MNHTSYTQTTQQPAEGIDWDTIMEITPALVSVTCWALWGLFLLIPTTFGLHYAPMFSTANNTVFVLMGFILCIAVSTAIRAGDGATAVFFAAGVTLLSYWF